MARSTLGQLSSQFLSRCLKFLASLRGLPPFRLINHLFALLASFRRRTRANPRRPASQGPPISSVTSNNDVVCAMTVPSIEPSDEAQDYGRPSPVDSPYTNARSPSGHLIPYSPAPARRYSRELISWLAGDQNPIHEEPREVHEDASQVAVDSALPASSTTNATHYNDHPPGSGILLHHPSQPPGPLHHHVIGFATDTGPPDAKSSPHTAHRHIDATSHRSKTPLSMNSSQRSFNSGTSIGRASYRVHHGPTARARTPALNQDTPASLLGTAEPSGTAAFSTSVALPSADDPTRPGKPVGAGPRFFPMSTKGLFRYEFRKTR